VRRFISAGSGDFAFARKFVTQHYQYSGSPTEPASILPSQFFDGQKKKEAVEPLKRLMLAVLADAVRCYQTGFDRRATSRRRVFLEAQQWLFRPGADGAFSFETVCYARLSSSDVAQLAGQKAWRHLRPRRPPLSGDLS
jgi:hypothetical protein